MSPPDLRQKKHDSATSLREIEVLIYSANDLKNVKHVSQMKTYAEVYVEKDIYVAKTHVDEYGKTNPMWNEVLKVKFHAELPVKNIMAALNVDIYAYGHIRDKLVGSARVLLCDVLKSGDASEPLDNPIQCLTVQVWGPCGTPHGFLNLWVPPTGRFLVRLDSLSFSVRETENQLAEEEVKIVVDEEEEDEGDVGKEVVVEDEKEKKENDENMNGDDGVGKALMPVVH